MTLLSEKIVVTAKEFLKEKNINHCPEVIEPLFQAKMQEFDWDIPFSAASITCETIWKISLGKKNGIVDWRQLDKLFSPSPVGTYCNFRGCKSYKTGNLPEVGALVIWRRGNSWQGHMAIVTAVSDDKNTFDVIEGRIVSGSENNFIQVIEAAGKRTGLPFKNDKLNILGFIYCKHQEIN